MRSRAIVLGIVLTLGGAAGCGNRPIGSMDGGSDGAADGAIEAAGDRGDLPREPVAEVGADVPMDIPAEASPDLPVDSAGPEPGPERPDSSVDLSSDGAVDAGADLPPACPPPLPEALAWEPRKPDAGAAITTIASTITYGTVLVGYSDGQIHWASGNIAAPTWIRVDNATSGGQSRLPGRAVSALAVVDLAEPGVYAGYAEGGGHHVWKSAMLGRGWSEVAASPTTDVWGLAMSPLDTSTVYLVTPVAETGTAALYTTYDSGATWPPGWSGGSERLWPFVNTNVTGAISSAAGYRSGTGAPINRVWVGTTSGDVAYTQNPSAAHGDQSWTRASQGGRPARPVTRLNLLPPVGDAIYPELFVTYESLDRDGIFHSPDGGNTWRNLHGAGLPARVVVYGVSVNPVSRVTLYAATSAGPFRSNDGGDCWSPALGP